MALLLTLFNFAMAAAVGIMVMPRLSLEQNAVVVAFGLGLYLLGDYVDDRHTIRINSVRKRINAKPKRVPASRA